MGVALSQRDKVMFPVIYALHYKPTSQCEFFKVVEREGYYMGWCEALERYIVRSSVYKCERYWQTCPFRRSALQVQS
jgi:hypothetical protein